MVEDKEARLVRIVQKLESKIKTVWDENKQLTQRLSLAELDGLIAQEQCESLENELKSAELKIKELEELQKLNIELENSYALERQNLEHECESLKAQLEAVNFNIQKFEILQLELANAQWQLRSAELETRIVKMGMTSALTPLFEPLNLELDWLPLIDALHIDVDRILSKYKQGNISLIELAELLRKCVDDQLDNLKAVNNIDIPPEYKETPRWVRVQLAIDRGSRAKDIENQDEVTAECQLSSPSHEPSNQNVSNTSDSDEQSEAMRLRIAVLESKLEKACSLVEELESLRKWQEEAQVQQAEFKNEIAEYKQLLNMKNDEIAHLHRENLPTDVIQAKHQLQLTSLNSVIRYLSSRRPDIELEDLKIETETKQISNLVGNRRVHKLRKLALTFDLGETPMAAQKLAIQQATQLMFL